MPETRYIIEFEDGVEVNRIPYEVSDEQLYLEQLDIECSNDIHTIKDAYDNWDSLSPTQKREVVKLLCQCAILLLKDRL